MKLGFYARLAWDGIRKNGRFYIPYLLTCVGMVSMYAMVAFLFESPAIASMSGGGVVVSTLGFGRAVIALFAVIFLFSTHSFLMRRRKREFGLYNVLGMNRRNIARIMLLETAMIAGISLTAGLAISMLLSKLAELALLNLLHEAVSVHILFSLQAVLRTVGTFAAIFALLLLQGLWQVRTSSAVALLASDKEGERPPRANWLLSLLGLGLLLAAYDIAVHISEPITAMVWFFVAVMMVIVATNLVMVSGSVALCRLLQKNKRYYYQPNHFVSVSSMAYRMKRTGSDLATICILSTMVLVMISSTASLYVGLEDVLDTRYPRSVTVETRVDSLEHFGSEEFDFVRRIARDATAGQNAAMEKEMDMRIAGIDAYYMNGEFLTDGSAVNLFDTLLDAQVWLLCVLPLEDYNRLTGGRDSLGPDEAIVIPANGADYRQDTVRVRGTKALSVVRVDSTPPPNADAAGQISSVLYVIVADLEEYVRPLMDTDKVNMFGEPMVRLQHMYGFDLDAPDSVKQAVLDRMFDQIGAQRGEEITYFQCEGDAGARQSFYSTFGGLFFLGVMLSIVFALATVLMIYYKQVSEGYEDQARFAIMMNVGMTAGDIRRSINTQMLTVFFLPLLLAGSHLAFAFPMIRKILVLFGFTNLPLLSGVTVVCVLVFAALYTLLYKVTTGAYYAIVTGEENR